MALLKADSVGTLKKGAGAQESGGREVRRKRHMGSQRRLGGSAEQENRESGMTHMNGKQAAAAANRMYLYQRARRGPVRHQEGRGARSQ